MAFHQVDRSSQSDAFVEDRLLAGARRVAAGLRTESERKLEVLRNPILVVHRDVLQPAAQIGSQILDFRSPDAFDGGGKVVREFGGNKIENAVGDRQRFRQPLAIYR